MTNTEKFAKIKKLLAVHGITCCGYVEQGKDIQVYNSLAQLHFKASDDIEKVIEKFLKLWLPTK